MFPGLIPLLPRYSIIDLTRLATGDVVQNLHVFRLNETFSPDGSVDLEGLVVCEIIFDNQGDVLVRGILVGLDSKFF